MNDPFYIYRPGLDLLGLSEGTDKKRGYNETLAYGAYTDGDRNLVAMTLDQIEQLQTKMLLHPKNKLNSSALGRYQIVRKTLRKLKTDLKLSGTLLYDKGLQDRFGVELMRGRGIDIWLAGDMSEDALINALAKEWASLPTTSGFGHYDGQRASVSVVRVRQVLAEIRRRRSDPTPKPVPVNTGSKPAPSEDGFLVRFLKAIFGVKA